VESRDAGRVAGEGSRTLPSPVRREVRQAFGRDATNPLNRIGPASIASGFRASGSG